MTMLDRMRRHKNWLKWSLGLVCLAFVFFYVPDFLRNGAGAASLTDVVARVDGNDITAADFRRTYQAQLQMYRGAYGANMNEQLLKQLGIDQQILQQMVDERAALSEADRVGITVSDAEIRERILRMPALQENGHFIGEQRYRQLLGMQRPPVTPADFEDSLRKSLAIQKLRLALTDWMALSNDELEQEFRRRNEKVKLEVVALLSDKFRDQVVVSDADLTRQFDAHKADYRVGEKRKIRFVLLDVDALRAKANVTPTEIERYYNDNIQQYSTPEQVRVSHILFKTQEKDEAAVRAKAEDVLKQARAGADFAELARKNSDDEGTVKVGGDMDYIGRGQTVPEFEQASFAAQPGTITDLVKTQYGLHIIKVIDKKAATTRPLAEVRGQIQEQLAAQRAQQQAADQATTLEKEIKKPADLDRVAKSNGLTVQESGFFARDEPILGLGLSPEVSARAFEMNQGEMSGSVHAPRGDLLFSLVAKQDPYIPKLEEVRDRVREDVVKEKARDLARQKAQAVAASLKSAADFGKAAKAAGLESKSTELISRESPLPEIGISAAVDRVAFAMPANAVSDPITADTGVAIVKVVEKKDVTPADLVSGRDQLKQEMLADRKNRFFSAYMVKAKQKMKIEVNRETLQRVVGAA